MRSRSLTRFLQPVVRRLQSLIARGVVQLVYADRNLQVVQCELLKGEVRELEHFEPYGFTAKPLEGAEVLALFVGGSRGHGIVVATPDRRHRLTGLADGEVAIYNDQGAQVILRNDGSVEINAPGGVALTGDLNVTGNIAATGQVADADGDMTEMRTIFNAHTHPGDSGGNTGTPSTPMT